MFDLSVLLNVEMQILIFFGLGLLLKKRGVTDGPIDAFLSTLILNLIMPVNIFLSFYRSVSVAVLKESLLLVLAGVIVVVLVLGMSRLLPKSMPLEKKRIAQYSMLISNGSLIGLPLIEGLCGSMGVVYANIFMIPTRILSFCSGEKYFNTEWKPAGALSVMKKFFFNPITIAMILGFLFNLARIPLPGGLDAVFSSLSGCMSPLALLLVGSTLLDRESTSMGLSKDIVQISLFRLIIAPFLTWIVGVALHLSTPQLIAAVLVNATPVASTATIFCRKYNGNTSYTSRCVFFSTVFSLFTFVLVSATMSMG